MQLPQLRLSLPVLELQFFIAQLLSSEVSIASEDRFTVNIFFLSLFVLSLPFFSAQSLALGGFSVTFEDRFTVNNLLQLLQLRLSLLVLALDFLSAQLGPFNFKAAFRYIILDNFLLFVGLAPLLFRPSGHHAVENLARVEARQTAGRFL